MTNQKRSDNKYVVQIEKTAGLGVAALWHAMQSAGTNAALRHGVANKTFATKAAAGFLGKDLTSRTVADKVKDGVLGVVSPDIKVMSEAAHGMGAKVRDNLLQQGVKPEELTKRQLVRIRQLTQGKFNKVRDSGAHRTPEGRATLSAVGISPEQLDMLPRGSLDKAEEVWRNPNNPLTSNVASNVTRPNKAKLNAAKQGDTTFSNTSTYLGNATGAIVDPISAGINASKTLLTSPVAEKNKYLRAVRDKASTFIYENPTEASLKKGLSGQRENPVLLGLQTNLVNPVSGNMRRMANDIGIALHEGSGGTDLTPILNAAKDIKKATNKVA